MRRGPKLNNISKNFTTRDSLGIEGVAATIQGEVCPIVNTVTPRAFYWPFMVWIYYDFYKYSGIEDYNYTAFDQYLKRQDYFFVLATLLTEGSDQVGLVGKQQTELDILNNPVGPYAFNPRYFKTRFGGMQYYNAGCLSMYFVTDHDDSTGKEYALPRLSQHGEKLAKAFENVISNTRYYKEYRRNDKLVPKDVLEEYGQVIDFGLKGFDECKTILREYLFEKFSVRSELLSDNGKYIKYIIDNYGVKDWNRAICRQMFFDFELSNGDKIQIPDDLTVVSRRWEIVVGRQYFTTGLEMIWKFILEILNEPLTANEWIESIFSESDFSYDIEGEVAAILPECNYSYSDREEIISAASHNQNQRHMLENGIKIILSTYNRFYNRSELGDERNFFDYGSDSNSVPFSELFETVEEYKTESIKKLMVYVIKNWIIEQHYATAFEKMLQNRDGFYFEIVDDRYVKKHDFDMRFQDIRMTSLKQVMTDIDML